MSPRKPLNPTVLIVLILLIGAGAYAVLAMR